MCVLIRILFVSIKNLQLSCCHSDAQSDSRAASTVMDSKWKEPIIKVFSPVSSDITHLKPTVLVLNVNRISQ